MRIEGKDFVQCVVSFVFAAALSHAAAMDRKYQRVRRGIWLWAGAAAVSLFVIRAEGRPEEYSGAIPGILCFILLQFFLFAKLYGLADCFAFSCCSVFIGAFGGELREFLLHMLLSTGILGFVQFCRGNVNRFGNLKEPKAFIPYIAAALPVIVLWLVRRELGENF